VLLKVKMKIKTPRIETKSNLVTITIHTVRFHKIIHATLVVKNIKNLIMNLIMKKWNLVILHSGMSIHSIFWRPVSQILIKFVNNHWILKKPRILSPLLTLTVVKRVTKRLRVINKMFMEWCVVIVYLLLAILVSWAKRDSLELFASTARLHRLVKKAICNSMILGRISSNSTLILKNMV
jgi:hypothetical protein